MIRCPSFSLVAPEDITPWVVLRNVFATELRKIEDEFSLFGRTARPAANALNAVEGYTADPSDDTALLAGDLDIRRVETNLGPRAI